MANKNRFNIILTTLNTLVVFMLLNSCGGELNVNGINGTHTNFNPIIPRGFASRCGWVV